MCVLKKYESHFVAACEFTLLNCPLYVVTTFNVVHRSAILHLALVDAVREKGGTLYWAPLKLWQTEEREREIGGFGNLIKINFKTLNFKPLKQTTNAFPARARRSPQVLFGFEYAHVIY